MTTAVGVLFGRKVATVGKVGAGHPLKHRALDLAAGSMQRKYPLEAMSTYLNGFHMYADEMGRQVECDLRPQRTRRPSDRHRVHHR
ncbi:hypothetical protein [Streptomyces tendae]|uniref:hypothetical protein n=1 Tax=Streptomyces tendae TaxID=1932 RepID=UPI00369E97C6